MSRLKGKVAIVTGAAAGIGLAISRAFAQEQARVMMSDIDMEKCKAESDQINAGGGTTYARKCSVGVTAEMENLVQVTIEKFGQIDILVNNAAVGIAGNIMDMPEADWDRLMNVNLKSVFRGIKLVLPHMVNQRSGSVITISSVQAFRSWNDWTAYAGAKGAILSMTNQLAGQFGEYNIRFNTISPGAILTPMNERRIAEEGEEFREKSVNQAALKRMGRAEEVAMTAVFLASEESSFITGEDIKVDGGLCALPRYI